MNTSTPIQILHVDDEPNFAEMVARFLEREDDRFVVHTATTTEEGLARLGDTDIDCIVSDYEMPDRTGVEFLEAVREDHPDLPFILFTGRGSEQIASHAITAGVTDYLQKKAGTSQYTILSNRIRNAVSRRRALREQKENERRFEAVFEDPQVLVGILDAGGRVEQINHTAMEFIGPDHEEIVGDPFWRTPWWDDASGYDVEGWVERAAAGEYVSFDADLTRPNGDPYSITGTLRPVTDDDGSVVSLIVSAKEITEQRRRQQALDEEQAFINQALDTLDDTFYVVDTDGSLRRWNNSLRDVTGYSDAEIAEMHVAEFFSDDDAERVLDSIREVIETGRATVQAEFATADGSHLPYEFTGARLTDSDGQIAGLVGIGRDLSGRRAREREIERVRDLLEKTERIADVGGWEIDTETMEVSWTDHLFDLLGGAYEEEPPLEDALDLYHEADRPLVANAVDEALSSGEPFDVEARFRTPDDSVRWLRVQGKPELEDGEVVTLRGAVQDITDRKQYEETLERQNDRLDEFSSVVSHDLRNPLSIAEGHVELARDDCDSPHLDAVARAHERMDTLIEDLLTLSREGREVRDVEVVELPAFVEACWTHVAAADATLDVTLDGRIRADRSRLRQLLENVLRNGVEHGGSDATIRVGRLSDGFYVEDTGGGPSEADPEAAFESGRSALDGGSGFGLSIVRRIAEAHGWAVRVTERSSGGARLEITGVRFVD
ncbi:hypothetical protein DJ69_12995 [Halorubrum persicum]|uniref:histidine kinase n=1 Tax=Halorubrum persicum TaxID=1383844 RepID=A0A2G1WGQ2_9EURY|nr:PAS domain-containing protein [Halorubrum persicum]PHQ38177.1 hypothetical protein DJ69_12995 [Halorubrum persicum]